MICFQANILLVYVWLPLGYLVPSCCNYFGCTSFFVDIYHHDFVYLESYTLERSCISSWYPFFHVHLIFLMLFLWWLCESFCLECVSYIVASWRTLVWWRLFSSCLSLRGFCHLNWYPSSWWGFHLPSSPWVVTSVGYLFCFLSVLVNPFAWCVWGGHVMHLVSPLSKTMLMLNDHPYFSLLKCFAMTHTHHFGWAYS